MKYFGFIGFLFASAGLVAAIKGNVSLSLSLIIIALAFIVLKKS